MKLKTFGIAWTLVMAIFLFAQRRTPLAAPSGFRAAIDLTHAINDQVPNWEGTEKSPFEAHKLGDLKKNGYFSRTISLPEHFGTHIDAPAHFSGSAWTVDQIPPDHLIAPLALLDVTQPCRSNPDYEITVQDIAAWEQKHGHIPPGAVVLARTGWVSRWNSMKDYRNADAQGVMHFPGFSLEAARFLVESRGIYGLGIDTLSADPGKAQDFPVHHYTLPRNVYHLENVGDMSQVPEAGAILIAGPAKLEGGSGGPVRIFALLR